MPSALEELRNVLQTLAHWCEEHQSYSSLSLLPEYSSEARWVMLPSKLTPRTASVFAENPTTGHGVFFFGAVAIGCGAAFYGTDYFLWKLLYIIGALYAGLLWMEGWEECELDKNTGEMKITRKTVFQKLLPQYADQKIVVVQLDDIVGVRVDEEDVRYFGKSHIVVFLLSTGMTIGVTESHTFGSSKEHYEVADTLRTFLELDQPTQQVQDTDDYLGDGSSSDDSFEQVDRMDLETDPDLDTPTDSPPQ